MFERAGRGWGEGEKVGEGGEERGGDGRRRDDALVFGGRKGRGGGRKGFDGRGVWSHGRSFSVWGRSGFGREGVRETV